MIDKVLVDQVIEEWKDDCAECCAFCETAIRRRPREEIIRNLVCDSDLYHRLLDAGMTFSEVAQLRNTVETAGAQAKEKVAQALVRHDANPQ